MKILTLLLIPVGLLKAQTAVLVTGSTASGADGSVSYSVGQAAYSQKGANLEVMEGVQYAYEITILDVDDESVLEKNILLYPNPVRDLLNVDFGNESYQNSSYSLYDAQGKLLKAGKLAQKKNRIEYDDIASFGLHYPNIPRQQKHQNLQNHQKIIL